MKWITPLQSILKHQMLNMVWFLWIRDLLRVQLGGSVSGKLSSWVYSHDKVLLGLKILLLPSLLWLLVASVTHWRFRGFWSPPCELSALGYMQHGTLLPSEQTVQERGLEMEAVVPLQPHAGSGIPSFLPRAGGCKAKTNSDGVWACANKDVNGRNL